MKKKLISLALALLLVISCLPGAYALEELEPLEPMNPSGSVPMIYGCQDIVCSQGDMAVLNIAAQSPDGSALTYQWYLSLDGSNTVGSMIVNANRPSYTADTSQVGEFYYFCVVQNAGGSVISAPIAVRVEEKREAQIQGIGVLTLPDKVQYKKGEILETEGLSIRVYTDQGHFDVSGGLECSPALMVEDGEQTITVRYMDKECSFTVEVEEEKEMVQSISVISPPGKTTYTVGDKLDMSGMKIRLIGDRGSMKDVDSGFTCTPMTLNTAGRQTIKVIYGGVTTTFTVTVEERSKPSATPQPTAAPTATPGLSQQPAPAESPTVQQTQAPSQGSQQRPNDREESNTGMQIVLLVAIFALVGLGAYVYMVQKRKSQDEDE